MEQVRVDAGGHILLLCAECGGQRRFEQPPCLDGHGADCPEWACVECGAAVLVGALRPVPSPVPPARADEAPARLSGTAVPHRYVA
jgi:hypothetical protein